MYTAGNRFVISVFGKSHGKNVGCIIKGLPKGMRIDTDFLRRKMDLRRPNELIGSKRKENDEITFEYGVDDDTVTSDEIVMSIPNTNIDPSAYTQFDTTPRPGHADLPALMKFRGHKIEGGAQFSGRMTAPIVAAGALAQQYLSGKGIGIATYTRQIYDVVDNEEHTFDEMRTSESYVTRAIGKEMDSRMTECILKAKEEGDSVGGVISCMVTGLPIGFGGIWFDAVDVSLSKMIMAIPGVKGIEFGKGFGIASMKGSESNDQYRMDNGRITSSTNNMGGICGGMGNGMPITFNVAFKPTPSIAKEQNTVNLRSMTDERISVKGRHDPCIVPRAVSVVEAMAAITILDQYLSQ